MKGESKVVPVVNNALLYDGRRMYKWKYSSTHSYLQQMSCQLHSLTALSQRTAVRCPLTEVRVSLEVQWMCLLVTGIEALILGKRQNLKKIDVWNKN
jgi:hypothetical protein